MLTDNFFSSFKTSGEEALDTFAVKDFVVKALSASGDYDKLLKAWNGIVSRKQLWRNVLGNNLSKNRSVKAMTVSALKASYPELRKFTDSELSKRLDDSPGIRNMIRNVLETRTF